MQEEVQESEAPADEEFNSPSRPQDAVYGHTASMPSPYFVGQTLVTSIDLAGILLLM